MSYYSKGSSSGFHEIALPASKKTHSEKSKQILKQLLKEESNKKCSDCKTASYPRWASWSLGCFVCIRCSGIHRSMGTHISKVKSVDLDTWTDEQVQNMVKWGNEKCNSYWEAKLPSDYIPDQLKIDNFIRTKYEMKKWVSGPSIPDPMKISVESKTKLSKDSNTPNTSRHTSGDRKIHSHHHKKPQETRHTKSNSLLSDDFGDFESSAASSASISTHVPQPGPAHTLHSEKGSSNHYEGKESTNNSLSSNNARPDLKKSILSLYSSPSSSNSSVIHQSFPQNTAVRQVNSFSNSLADLNFNANSYSSPQASLGMATKSGSGKTTSDQKNLNNGWLGNKSDVEPNPWNSSSYSFDRKLGETTTSGLNNLDLEDDLFKNVWRS